MSRDATLVKNKLKTLSNTLIVSLESTQYGAHEAYENATESLVKFYYQDPFADTQNTTHIGDETTDGLEQSSTKAGIGWEESNTMLLSVSAGESVGKATKDFQTFSLITL